MLTSFPVERLPLDPAVSPARLVPRPRADVIPGPVPVTASVTRARPAADLEVAIPAYNERNRLPRTLERTVDFLAGQPWSSRVVVVDNGSSDETVATARAVARTADSRVPVEVVGCAQPGKGAAVRRALLSSRSRLVGFLDADMATPVETLTAAVAALEGGAVAAIASRHHPESRFARSQPLGRQVGGAAFRAVARGLVPGVRDTQCGFKFFQRAAVSAALVQCRTGGFAFDVELLWRLHSDGGRIVELPVEWTDDEASTFRPLQDGIASFGALRQVQRMRQK